MSAPSHQEPLDALRTLLRSFGQIVLQPSAATGACILAAWLVCDPRLACAALTGAIAANIGALLRGYDAADTRDGLHGFNGALASLAAFTFIAEDSTAIAVAILAATAVAWLLGPWARLLRSYGLGVYSSPCLLVTWTWLPLVHPASAHAAATDTFAWLALMRGMFAGLAQTSFAGGALAGALILGGIAWSSRRSALFALAGAALATSSLWLVCADYAALDAGLLGFNGALAALALADCGAPAALMGVGIAVALQQAASMYGVPALSAPFVLATWTVRVLARDTRREHATHKEIPVRVAQHVRASDVDRHAAGRAVSPER